MKKQKLITMLVLMIILTLSIVGCGNENNKIPAAGNEENNHEEKEAYAKLLQDYQWLCDNTDYDKVPNEVKFLQLDIDQNGVYELLIYHNTSSADAEFTVSVITYNDGEISIEEINAGHGGYYGYDKENKVFATKHLQQGFEVKILYTIEDNKIKESCRWMVGEGAGEMFQDLYKINGQAVDKDEFIKFTSMFNLDTASEEYTMHEISYENIVKYLGVETMDDDELTFLEAKHLILENDKNYIEKTQIGKDGVRYSGYTFEVTEDDLETIAIKKPVGNYYSFEMVYDEMTQPGGYYVNIEDGKVYTHTTQAYAHHYRVENNRVVERLESNLDEALAEWRSDLDLIE